MLNGLDGYDVLSIAFASPGIAADWGIDRAVLGVVLSMELIGMGIGSVILGNLADQIGRRSTALISLVVMAVGMFAAALSNGVVELSVVRFITGLGIGGMLAVTNAIVAEFSNSKRRNLAIVFMAGGYPVGALLGGFVAAMLLDHYSWRSVFYLGAAATIVFIPLTLIYMKESVAWLSHKRPPNALEKINATLRHLGHKAIDSLPAAEPAGPKIGLLSLFSKDLRVVTVLLCCLYFFHIMTFYYILKWIPKIVVDMGFAASSAGGVLNWATFGGACGALVIGLMTLRFDTRYLVGAFMILATVAVTLFGQSANDLSQLSMLACLSGLFTNGAICGVYALMAHYFPTNVRAGGTGFVIGMGRGGAALGPILAGVLFAVGLALPGVSLVMSLGSLVAAVALFALILYGRRHGEFSKTQSS
jgi:benzoate transport